MTENLKTVVVPVALIKAAAEQIPGSALASQFRDLIPLPRLVAVTLEQWGEIDNIRELPDLMTLLEETVSSTLETFHESAVWPFEQESLVEAMTSRIRTALGVSA